MAATSLIWPSLSQGCRFRTARTSIPTKAGYSSISFGGRFGRTARINVDGIDISDETVGTTTADIPASAIAEFQLSQSSLDLSQDLTSSGAVNVTTQVRNQCRAWRGFRPVSRQQLWVERLHPEVPIFPPSVRNSADSVGGPVIKR